jgi:putative peptidoglycan lipid II flippase
VKRIGKLIIPTIFGLGITQANLLLNTILASFLAAGSVTFLFYGMRLIHFPLGLVGIALATAILPSLSALTADGAHDELNRRVEFGLRHVFFLMIPATVGLIMLRTPLIHLFFEHGEFTAEATRGTAIAVAFYAIGLWAFGSIRIVVSAFYAMQDTRTPVRVAMLALCCNIALSLSLMGPLQHGGLALATSVATMLNVSVLLVFLVKKIGHLDWRAILTSLLRTAIASVVVVVICRWVAIHDLWIQNGDWSAKAMLLGAGVVLSIAGYLGIHMLMRSPEFTAMRHALAKR